MIKVKKVSLLIMVKNQKLIDCITILNKLIISRDVKSGEEDSWDGNNNKQVTRGAPILQSDDELNEQGTQTPPNTQPRNFVQGTSPLGSNIIDELLHSQNQGT